MKKSVVVVSREALRLFPVGEHLKVYMVFPGVVYLEASDGKIIDIRVNEYSVGSLSFVINCNLSKLPFSFYQVGDLFKREKNFLLTKIENIIFKDFILYDPDVEAIKNKNIVSVTLMDLLKSIIIKNAYPKGFTPLLLDEKDDNILKKAYLGIKNIFEFNFINYEIGIKNILGTGEGFTPSGDDFLTGFSLGLRVFSKSLKDYKKNYLILNELISYLAKQYTSKISYNFISEAISGRVSMQVKDLIQSLYEENFTNLEEKVFKVLNLGHSSGADFLTGFYFSYFFVRDYESRSHN